MAAWLRNLTKNFCSDESGSFITMFGLLAPVMFLAAGTAIDASRAYHTKSRLVAAVDAAALAAGRALLDGRMTDDELEQRAIDYFNANLNANGGRTEFGILADPIIQIDRSRGSVLINATAEVPTAVMQLAGFEKLTVPVTSETTFDQQDIELSLALDLTGSMGRGEKLPALKDATNDLLDIMLPDGGTPNQIRIALAPYSSGVNAGEYARRVTNNDNTGPCTFEREGRTQATDAVPENGSYILEASDRVIGSRDACPSRNPVVPLTSDKNTLESAVENFRPRGYTAGHLGIQWAWFTVSEAWAEIFTNENAPTPYGTSGVIKAVVVMTDGEFNTVNGKNGPSRSSRFAREMCSEMRDNGIIVFTIGFELREENARQVLQDCAANDDRYFLAEDGESLRQAFTNIAFQLNNLRLSR